MLIKLMFPNNTLIQVDEEMDKLGTQFRIYNVDCSIKDVINVYFTMKDVYYRYVDLNSIKVDLNSDVDPMKNDSDLMKNNFDPMKNITSIVYVFPIINDSYVVFQDDNIKFIPNKNNWNDYMFSIQIVDEMIFKFLAKSICHRLNIKIELRILSQLNAYYDVVKNDLLKNNLLKSNLLKNDSTKVNSIENSEIVESKSV